MRWEFRLGDVMVSMFHGHGKKDTSKGRVNGCRGNLFNKGMETMKVKNGQNPVREPGKRHSQRDAIISGQILWGGEGVVSLCGCDIMEEAN